MFNLDHSISVWRQKMTAGGIKNPAVLDELESHLREDVERQVRAGMEAEKAFVAAVQKIGPANALKKEFKKSAGANVIEKMMIALAVLFVAFGIFLSSVTVILCYLTMAERVIGFAAMGISILIACSWRRLTPYLPVIREKRKRSISGIACLLGGFGLATLYVQAVVPHFVHGLDRILPAMGFWALFPIAIGFGLASGLEHAARGEEKQLLA
jgi:hypothetical protein